MAVFAYLFCPLTVPASERAFSLYRIRRFGWLPRTGGSSPAGLRAQHGGEVGGLGQQLARRGREPWQHRAEDELAVLVELLADHGGRERLGAPGLVEACG